MTYKLENAKILLVDDMQPMLTLTKSLLGIYGFKDIVDASNVETAFKLYCKTSPDLVITDWVMEPDDGMELVRRIRKDKASPNQYVPIIVMTGFSSRPRVESARDRGITEFLVKPFSARDLFAKIEHIIEKPRQFVDTGAFFGPDRRRKRGDDYAGPRRRQNDGSSGRPTTAEEKNAADVLKKLIRETKDISKR